MGYLLPMDDPIVHSMMKTGLPPWAEDDGDEDDDDYGFDEPDEDEEEPEEEEPTALIQVTSLPQIQENLRALRERWNRYAKDAEALICTEDTVQAVKTTRAELRKEFDEAEAERKAAKAAYMAPWEAVEATYKECVSDAFKAADGALKAKIGDFEGELKAKCKAELQSYFDELCLAHGVDFLTLDTALSIGKLKIGLADAKSKSAKKLKTDLSDVVARVAVGMDQIMQMPEDDRAEVMAEYKTSLDVGHAVATVEGRKRRIAAEKEAEEARRAAKERQQEAAAKVEAVAPATEIPEPPRAAAKMYRITFTINCTREQGIKVRDFLNQEGIQYE